MIRAAALAFAMAGPAASEDFQRLPGFEVAAGAGAVTIRNHYEVAPEVACGTVAVDGVPVRVCMVAGMGREPDEFHVQPPRGWRAVPEWVTLEEDARATVLIVMEPVG